MKCIRLKKIEAGAFSLLLLITFFMVTASAQTGSLAVWENIPDGVQTSEWVEIAELGTWTVTNLSGTWVINGTSPDIAYAYNDTIVGNRWYQTCFASSDEVTTGIGFMMRSGAGDNDTYAVAYYFDSPYHPLSGAYLYYFNDTEFLFWNNSEWVETSDTVYNFDSGQDWQEINYSVPGKVRMKAVWNFNDAEGFSLRFKLWERGDDEPVNWLVDDAIPMVNSVPPTFKAGVFLDNSVTPVWHGYFHAIMFWDLAWDTYEETDLPHIACPTFGYDNFMELYEEFLDLDDLWNATQLFKGFINTFDMISYYEDRLYDPLLENQEDNIYVLSQMFTDVRDLWEEGEYEDPDYAGEFPDNLLWLDFFVTPETEEDVTDLLMIRIDTDNNGVYDDYDYTITLWLNDTTFYNGTTEINDTVNWWGLHEKITGSSPIKEVFRDYNYTRYWLILNWDMFYNGSSGERIGSDLCRMSFMTVDGDTFTASILQDWNITDDTTPKDPSDDYDIWTNADPTLWLYFEVDESISGESMADPEDPVEEEEYTPTRIDTDSIIVTLNTFLSVILAIFFIGVVFKLFGKIRM